MFQFALLCGGLLSHVIHAQTQTAVLPSDFFYNIDGISVDLCHRYFCTLEQADGYDMGGTVRCFGDDKIVPPKDVFVQVSTSARGACGITLEQQVKCWGSPTHIHARQMDGLFTQISGGDNVICGLRVSGAISCFYGKWPSFQIQDKAGSNFVQVSCGLNYCCALDDKGHVHCGGEVAFGHAMQRGDLHENPHVVMQIDADGEMSVAAGEVIPQNVDSEEYEDFLMNPLFEKHPMKFKQIAVAHGYMCGIQYLGEDILCWGNADVVVPVTLMKGPFKMVSANDKQVCGILSGSNELKCVTENALTLLQTENEEEGARRKEWDQVKVGSRGQLCGVTMDSELICVHPFAVPEVLQELIIA